MKTIAITIEDDVLERVDRVATTQRSGKAGNRSYVIRTAVHEYLARLESAVEEERERAILQRHSRRLARQAAALVKDQAKP